MTSYHELVMFLYNRYLKNNTRFDEIYFWDNTREEDYDPRDWGLDRSSFEDLPRNEKDTLYIFDQGQEYRTRNACVPVSVISAHYNNHPRLTLDYNIVHEFINWCESQKIWKENAWANTPQVVNMYVKYWNEKNPNNKIASERLWYTSPALQDALDRWYQVVWSRNTFPMYNEDKVDNRRIDMPDYQDKKRRGGHCQTLIKGSFLLWGNEFTKRQIHIHKNGQTEINTTRVSNWDTCVNSYPVTHREYNIYAHNRLNEHCANGIWNSWFYVIYPIDAQEAPEKIKSDYEKYLERGFIEQPNPDRVITERLYGTLRERELRDK